MPHLMVEMKALRSVSANITHRIFMLLSKIKINSLPNDTVPTEFSNILPTPNNVTGYCSPHQVCLTTITCWLVSSV